MGDRDGPPLTAEPTPSTRDVRRGQPVDLAKLRSLSVGSRTRPHVREGRRADGVRVKATTDELGNTVTEHASRDDRVDVLIRPDTVKLKIGVQQ